MTQRWVIDAAHRDTGEAAQFIVQAASHEQAAAMANESGYVVAHVCPAPASDSSSGVDFDLLIQHLQYIERQVAPISGWFMRPGPKIATGIWFALGWWIFGLIVGVIVMVFTCVGGLGLLLEGFRAAGGQGAP